MTTATDWIAGAPNHWSRGRLKDLLGSVKNGVYGDEPRSSETDVECVRAADFDRERRRVNDSGLPKRAIDAGTFRQHALQQGDLILEKSGGGEKQPVGMVVLYDRTAPAVCSNFCARITRAPGIDARFLKYVFSATYAQGLTQSAIKQTTGIQNLDVGAFLSTPWCYPGEEEQRRIADFLDAETARIDRLAQVTALQVDVLKERIIEFFRVMTTTGGASDSTCTGVPWMPSIACDWRMAKVGLSFLTGSGTTPRASDPQYFDGDYFWVNTGDLRDSQISHPRKTVTDKALADYPTLRLYPPGSLIVAMYGATTGRVGILDVPACVNQACCVLTESGPTSSDYAYFWFRAHRNEILQLASGGGQPNISQDLVRSLRIPIPSREQQSAIVRRCRTAEDSISQQQGLLRRRGALLAERRQALITAAVTGQFDVSSASGRGVTEGVPSA